MEERKTFYLAKPLHVVGSYACVAEFCNKEYGRCHIWVCWDCRKTYVVDKELSLVFIREAEAGNMLIHCHDTEPAEVPAAFKQAFMGSDL